MNFDMTLGRIPMHLLRFGLSMFGFFDNSFKNLFILLDRLKRAYTALFRRNYYIFFQQDAHPFSVYAVNPNASGSAPPELVYWADEKVFFPWIPNVNIENMLVEENTKCLPFLSLEIVNSADRVVYDLTDFLESVRFVELNGFPVPTLAHCLAVWSLSSGIVLDASRYKVRYIDTSGDIGSADSYGTVIPEEDTGSEESAEAQAEAQPEPEAQADSKED